MAAAVNLVGFDIPGLLATAGGQPVGQQKAKYTADVAAGFGIDPYFEIIVGTNTLVYQSRISGTLASDGTGVLFPTQFIEPPSANVANALSTDTCKIRIRNASNSSVYALIPVKMGGGEGFVSASKALDGSRVVRTSGFKLVPPSGVLDVGSGSSGGLYTVQTLIDDMSRGNPNDWYIEAAPNTSEAHHGNMGTIAQINIGLRRSDGRSHWPDYYLTDDNNYAGITLSDSTIVNNLPWWVVGRAATRSGLDNVRVQLRNHRRMILHSNNTWEVAVDDGQPIDGAQWHAYFRDRGQNEMLVTMDRGTALHQIRSHTSAEGGGESIGSIGYGTSSYAVTPDGVNVYRYRDWAGHGFNNSLDRRRDQWVGYKAVVYSIEHRLIMHNSGGTDNRANTALLMWLGADWRKDSSRGPIINAHGQGPLKLITSEWGITTFGDFNSQDLINNPPPGFTN